MQYDGVRPSWDSLLCAHLWRSLFFPWELSAVWVVRALLYSQFFFSFFFQAHHSAHGILVPQPGTESTTPALEVRGLNRWIAREVPKVILHLLCQMVQGYHQPGTNFFLPAWVSETMQTIQIWMSDPLTSTHSTSVRFRFFWGSFLKPSPPTPLLLPVQ